MKNKGLWIAIGIIAVLGVIYYGYTKGWFASLGLGVKGEAGKTDGEICYGSPTGDYEARSSARETGDDVPGVTCTDSPTIYYGNFTNAEFQKWAKSPVTLGLGVSFTGPVEDYVKCFKAENRRKGEFVFAPKSTCYDVEFQKAYKDPATKCPSCEIKS